MINLNYLMDHILYQAFKFILSVSSKRHETRTDNPPIRIYVKKYKVESHSKLKQLIIPNFYLLKLCNFLVALKIKQLKKKIGNCLVNY